ncbi:MAG: 4-(cytidine 5'-diphospho)-2-C-methyl-D-erythritol kinase [Candidatus Tantalella remota]|nr:4-(cytidine 5'-diphospho)-2-C-methyl-D-erythritol kinase [Candidatus Tantalella remota]
MKITAPAKINLYLEVLSKRDDGFHEIETLFERISLSDEISVEFAQGPTRITCSDSGIPTGEDSLLYRTVSAFNEKTSKKASFVIDLKKNIPVAAGLGGGSTDAASLLLALNELSGYPLDNKELTEIGRSLGADIAFFLTDCRFAMGRRRGDVIETLESQLEMSHILVNPPFGVSTKEVYNNISGFTLTKKKGVDRMFSAFLKRRDIEGLAENLHNDLQTLVLRDFPVLAGVFSEMKKAGSRGSLLSGSGPTVFGIFDTDKTDEAAEKLKKVFPAREGWQVLVARTY